MKKNPLLTKTVEWALDHIETTSPTLTSKAKARFIAGEVEKDFKKIFGDRVWELMFPDVEED